MIANFVGIWLQRDVTTHKQDVINLMFAPDTVVRNVSRAVMYPS